MKKTKKIGCEEAIRRLLPYLDQDLGKAQRSEVDEHLSACRSCFSRAEFEKHLKARLRETGRETVRAEFKNRIKELLGRF